MKPVKALPVEHLGSGLVRARRKYLGIEKRYKRFRTVRTRDGCLCSHCVSKYLHKLRGPARTITVQTPGYGYKGKFWLDQKLRAKHNV